MSCRGAKLFPRPRSKCNRYPPLLRCGHGPPDGMESIVAIGNDGNTGVGTTVADPTIIADPNQVAEGFATIGGTNHDVVAHVPSSMIR